MTNYATRPDKEWVPKGCNWAAMLIDPEHLALAMPEVGGPGGPFRSLTEEEKGALTAWIRLRQAEYPSLSIIVQTDWDPRTRG